jgi:hypothetical protein
LAPEKTVLPDTARELLPVLLLVVPGYLLKRAFLLRRSFTAPSIDLYALAEAIAFSVVVLAATWTTFTADLLSWIEDGTILSTHQRAAAAWISALLIGSYGVGLILGWVDDVVLTTRQSNAASRRKFASILRTVGFARPATVWDRTWIHQFGTHENIWLEIKTKQGRSIAGEFGATSWVSTSPAPMAVYLEAARIDGEEVESSIFVQGNEIETISFGAPVTLAGPSPP